jgi:hypothetical protein
MGAIPDAVSQELDAEMAVIANEFVNRAVQDAPVDQGVLKNSITFYQESLMNWKIVSGANYSAYVEFGTRSKVQVPSDVQDYASVFQGQGTGSAKSFFDSIKDWVKRKGIDEKAAYPIAISILRQGVNPHPYFFKQLPQAQVDINRNLSAVVQRALNS